MKVLMFSEWLKAYHNINHDDVSPITRNSYKIEYKNYLTSQYRGAK